MVFEAKMIFRVAKGQLIAILAFGMNFSALLFSGVHLALSTLMFATSGTSLGWGEMWMIIQVAVRTIFSGIIIMGIRHVLEFIDFIRTKEYEKMLSKNNQGGMDKLWIRIFFMQFTMIFGGVIAKVTNNAVLGVSLLILLQTAYSTHAFLKEKKASEQNP